MGLTTAIAPASPATVTTSCALLKLSLSTSNVPDGATRVQNRSSPCANMSAVDSSSAGEVRMRRVFATCGDAWGCGGVGERGGSGERGTGDPR